MQTLSRKNVQNFSFSKRLLGSALFLPCDYSPGLSHRFENQSLTLSSKISQIEQKTHIHSEAKFQPQNKINKG